MPRVSRSRVVVAPVQVVWDLVSDPYNLPRWWPRTTRVEGVDRKPEGRRSQWTKVLQTAEGRGVRADYRCLSCAERERYVWEQELEGTPFERHLASSKVEIGLREKDGETVVTIATEQRLRGLSRLGALLMRGAQRKIAEQALDGIEKALT